MRRQQIMVESGDRSSIVACLRFIQDSPHPEQGKGGLLSCSDLSGYWKNRPEGINWEIPSSGEVGPDDRKGLSENQWLWLDLEDELPLQPSMYSEIVAADWLEYCTWPRWALQKIFHLLQDCGQFWLLVRNRPTPFFRGKRENTRETAAGPCLKKNTGEIPDSADFHAVKKTVFRPIGYPAAQIQSMLLSLEFEIQQIRLYNDHGRCLHQGDPFRRQGCLRLMKKIRPRWLLSKENIWLLYLCKKEKSRSERFAERISRRSDFEKLFNQRYAEPAARLKRWLSVYPQYQINSIRPLDPPSERATVLVLSPHPDDEVIGCGGLLLHLIESGHRVVVLQLTDGSMCDSLLDKPDPYRHLIRIQEARQTAKAMGAECICWGETDGNLKCSKTLVEKMQTLLAELEPLWIFVPFVNDPHPDHRACNDLLQSALQKGLRNQSEAKIICYEVSSFLPPNACFRMDQQMHRKEELLFSYQSGLKPVDYMDFCLWRHAYASRIYTGRSGYIESFLVLSPEEYLSVRPLPEAPETDSR